MTTQTTIETAATDAFAPLAYTPIGAAKASGRSRWRIYQAIKAGELHPKKDGGRTLLLRDDLKRWLQNMPDMVSAAVLLLALTIYAAPYMSAA